MSRKPCSGHLEYSIRKRVKSIENQEKPKRKTHTSNEVSQRYKKKTYDRMMVSFRKVDDADILAAIAAKKAEGLQTSDAVKALIRDGLNK